MKKLILFSLVVLFIGTALATFNYSNSFYNLARDSAEVIDTFVINGTFYPPFTKEETDIVRTMNQVECDLATFSDHRRMKYYFTWELACKTLNLTKYDCWSCEGY